MYVLYRYIDRYRKAGTRDKPVPHVEYLPQDRLGVGMETSLLLLCGLTVLEVVLFQEVHVNLIVDIIQLQSCGLSDKANCHIFGRIYESQTGNFLQLCSVINIVINVMNLVFVYVTRSRQRHNNSVPVSVWCLNISTSGRLVTCWTVFKIVFNSVLVCGLLLTGGVTVTSVILISSLGKGSQSATSQPSKKINFQLILFLLFVLCWICFV